MASDWTRCTGGEAASKVTKVTLMRMSCEVCAGGNGGICGIDGETERASGIACGPDCRKGVCRPAAPDAA